MKHKQNQTFHKTKGLHVACVYSPACGSAPQVWFGARGYITECA